MCFSDLCRAAMPVMPMCPLMMPCLPTRQNSPLHDGAMIISNKRIRAAGCILPVSHNLDIPKELGLRHRAAMGISQETDALAIIVSEETGNISIARQGRFFLRLTAEELERMLTAG